MVGGSKPILGLMVGYLINFCKKKKNSLKFEFGLFHLTDNVTLSLSLSLSRQGWKKWEQSWVGWGGGEGGYEAVR